MCRSGATACVPPCRTITPAPPEEGRARRVGAQNGAVTSSGGPHSIGGLGGGDDRVPRGLPLGFGDSPVPLGRDLAASAEAFAHHSPPARLTAVAGAATHFDGGQRLRTDDAQQSGRHHDTAATGGAGEPLATEAVRAQVVSRQGVMRSHHAVLGGARAGPAAADYLLPQPHPLAALDGRGRHGHVVLVCGLAAGRAIGAGLLRGDRLTPAKGPTAIRSRRPAERIRLPAREETQAGQSGAQNSAAASC